MKGLAALAEQMGLVPDDRILYARAPVPTDEHLTFAKDTAGEEYGFRPALRDSNILECFYMRQKDLGHMPVSEVRVVTNGSAGIPLRGTRAAIVYRRAEGKHITATFFFSTDLREAYDEMPGGYAGYDPDPIVFANGLIVARKFSAKGLQWQAEDRARQEKSK